ncbi:MAG: flagellar basal body-associated FliL family protein, partial [Anaerolineae bacterium]|nr:flagellar basal body-associated FliL family protein [Anaerolineae bacterium]
ELSNTVIEDDVMANHTLPPELYARRPMMRDAVINVLSGKTAQELLSADGKETLKEELVEVLNEATAFDDAAILNVFFIEFIIQ